MRHTDRARALSALLLFAALTAPAALRADAGAGSPPGDEAPGVSPAPALVDAAVDLADARAEDVVDAEAERARLDREIEARLGNVFGQVDEFSRVEANVDHGVVHLSGTVLDPEQIERASELAKKLDGVLYVDNDIEEETSAGERIDPAIEQIRELGEEVIARAPLFAIALLVLILAWYLSKAVSKFKWPFRRITDKPLLAELARQVARSAVLVAGVLLALEILGLTSLVGAVLGTAGVAGLAVGFAFKDIVENYLASLLMSVRNPFRQGNAVKIGDHEGIITRMTTRDTVLMTFDGNHLRIPNAQVFKSVILNYSLNPRRRFSFDLTVDPAEELVAIKRAGLGAMKQVESIMDDPKPFMLIDRVEGGAIKCQFFGWVDQTSHDFGATRTEAVRRVLNAFGDNEIELAAPASRSLVYEMGERDKLKPSASRPADDAEKLGAEANEHGQAKREVERDPSKHDEEDLLSA